MVSITIPRWVVTGSVAKINNDSPVDGMNSELRRNCKFLALLLLLLLLLPICHFTSPSGTSRAVDYPPHHSMQIPHSVDSVAPFSKDELIQDTITLT